MNCKFKFKKVVKFIVVENCVYFGSKESGNDTHRAIAKKKKVFENSICGGGLADLINKEIFGYSYSFGRYDQKKVANLLPGWTVHKSCSSAEEIPERYRPFCKVLGLG